jgi:thiol-disulfide isomerase/thioredoxin
MRTLLAAVFAAALGTTGYADDPKPNPRAEKYAELQKAMRAEQDAAIKVYDAAEGAKAKDAAIEKFTAIGSAYALKFYKLAEEDPKDDVGYDAALEAFRLGKPNTAQKAVDLFLSVHLDNPKVKNVLQLFASNAEAGHAALRMISEKAKDNDTKGQATYYLGEGLLNAADYPSTGKPLKAEAREAKFREAEGILYKAAKEFGEVKVNRSTVAKEVDGQIYFLQNLTVGKTMPAAESQDLEGKKVKVSDYRGKVVVLDIWATWCGPCKAMIPHEREMTGKLKDKPFNLISLSVDDKKETLTKFLDTEAMPWTHWWNGGAKGGAAEAYKVKFFPTIYVLDTKGVIRHKHLRGDDLEKAVEKLLAESSGE